MVVDIILCAVVICMVLVIVKRYSDMANELKALKLIVESFRAWSEKVNKEMDKSQKELEALKMALEQYGETLKDNMPIIMQEKATQQELFEEWVYGGKE